MTCTLPKNQSKEDRLDMLPFLNAQLTAQALIAQGLFKGIWTLWRVHLSLECKKASAAEINGAACHEPCSTNCVFKHL